MRPLKREQARRLRVSGLSLARSRLSGHIEHIRLDFQA